MDSKDSESTVEQDVTKHPAVTMALQMPEILENIFAHLDDPTDLINSALVCRNWRDAAYHPTLWHRNRVVHVLQPSDKEQLLPSLARRRISEVVISGLRTHMRDLLPSLPALKHLRFGSIRKWSRFFSTITDRTLTGAFQQRHTSLISLHLCNCKRITDVSVTLLSSQLPNLKVLCLALCTLVTDVGLVAVARGLLRLNILYMVNCAITDEGVAALAGLRPDVASGTPLLRELGVSGCNITDAALQYVSVGLLELEGLWMAQCPQITDEGLGHLVNMGALRDMVVWDSPGITEDGLKQLLKLGKIERY